MLILKIFLLMVVVICSFLLIAVILLQKAKGEGLGLAFGSQMGESLFGARASNVLVRITVWLGVIFLISTTILGKMYARGYGKTLMERRAPIERKATPVQQPMTPAPFPASQPILPTEPVTPASIPIATPFPAPQPQE
ncbi:MAG: preprotein translocase subunit SecG [Verrucomicrobia bacterium]|nr:preprotein translocase subunit SecG [Verrucomicrobiota bacterium]MCG2680018.1 preprotein translocase subunit SecG [Kiritimatiellia bacterium]MBU4247307.1 preprotein translocase subunit SecG [Verrucomicrobiota bacterium]MBU4290688.1 preprotein translocase subunit SecG [Verrucomicrobiota bacterium]MBU4428869.1 preprotein translocase subunit SecG [Verrucomicrobiota bacterium]